MEFKIINVKNEINSPSALTREQGKIIFDNIVETIDNGIGVELDFNDIESLITPFLNVAIGKLYEKYDSQKLNEYLKPKNIPSGKVSSFNLVIENAKKYYSNKLAFDETIKDVIDV
ncbi:MAG: STAS-like domain-containing protein [Clostridiales bacterium]|jgi:hypothetical protein|nr:STAS-like domain-containing protein [Clostridiales bacterium]